MTSTYRLAVLNTTLVLVLALLGCVAQAAPADRKLPVDIEADRKHTDYKAGTAIYEGNVIVRQGVMLLKGDRLELTLKDGQLDRVVMEGRPATYDDRDARGEPIHGEARTMDYHATQEILTFRGEAQIKRAGDTLASERIIYNLRSEVVDAGGGAGERVHMTIQPRDTGKATTP